MYILQLSDLHINDSVCEEEISPTNVVALLNPVLMIQYVKKKSIENLKNF